PPDRLSVALDAAIAGKRAPLSDLLARASRLPGTRANDALADAFAQLCRGRGARADAVALHLARLTPDEAPGASPLEFLPVCGVLALGARATGDPAVRARFLPELHARADDMRFRVRDAVVTALSRIGETAGDALVGEVAGWMDGYFHAAAVLRALPTQGWLGAIRDAGPVLAHLDEAYVLVKDAPRAAARYPGHKALVEALLSAPRLLAVRFGSPLFDVLVRWAQTSDPVLRSFPSIVLADAKLASRFHADVARLRSTLDASLPPPRNPDHDFGPTRRRGRKA
ncbi:MAG: hypothetical protein ACRENE_22200, partial [Polyangiaceae bacterium]